ncbi:54S ribosomal protein yml6, mitochondrial [Dimargaris xerosporica]|nr:54S ribosomal protein yml6, mitochondrial [Dimargaris xerosporica]
MQRLARFPALVAAPWNRTGIIQAFKRSCGGRSFATEADQLAPSASSAATTTQAILPETTVATPFNTTVEAWVRDFKTNRPLSITNLQGGIFNTPIRKDLLHNVVCYERDAVRQGTHSTRGISDVRGTTRKPWPQKGLGKARAGTLRAPQFRGGGVVHGPKPRSHATEIPRKMWLAGLRSALSLKFLQNQLIIVKDFGLPSHKTNALFRQLVSHYWLFNDKRVTPSSTFTELRQIQQLRAALNYRTNYKCTTAVPLNVPAASVMFLPGETYRNLNVAAANIPNVSLMPAQDAEVYPILRHELLVLDLAAVKLLHDKLQLE